MWVFVVRKRGGCVAELQADNNVPVRREDIVRTTVRSFLEQHTPLGIA